jgi:guanine deaminase
MTEASIREDLMRTCIQRAVVAARESGGPFGALVAKDDRIVAAGTNAVTELRDPTAHAEIQAIRAACLALGTFDLTGCDLYTSCEPCPMCLGAIYWARIGRIYFSATRADAAAARFDDARIYEELARPMEERALPLVRILPEEAARPFTEWAANPRRVPY